MKKVFISGCYDILHGGHIQFFKEARALGDHLTVCIVDQVVVGDDLFHSSEDRDTFVASENSN